MGGTKADQGREEYIESELARRHAADKAAQAASASQQLGSSSTATPTSADPTKQVGDGPTLQGRLQEVDLGEEVRMRNAAMTEQARRRLAGEAVDEESDGSKRVRIGKDGKPFRTRKRRASEDIKRDQLVEELMRENRRMFLLYLWTSLDGILLILVRSGCLRCACATTKYWGAWHRRGRRREDCRGVQT